MWAKLIFFGIISKIRDKLAIVKVDKRGRMTIPKEVGFRGNRAIVIPAGHFLLLFRYQRSYISMQVHGFLLSVVERS